MFGIWFLIGKNNNIFVFFHSGSIDGNNQLVIKGRFQQKQIENVLRRYISKCVIFNTSLWNVPIGLKYSGWQPLVFNEARQAGLRRWGKMIVVVNWGGKWFLVASWGSGSGIWISLIRPSWSRLLVGSRLKAKSKKPICIQTWSDLVLLPS